MDLARFGQTCLSRHVAWSAVGLAGGAGGTITEERKMATQRKEDVVSVTLPKGAQCFSVALIRKTVVARQHLSKATVMTIKIPCQ